MSASLNSTSYGQGNTPQAVHTLEHFAVCPQCEKPGGEAHVPEYVIREVTDSFNCPQASGPTYEKRWYVICSSGHELRLTPDTRFYVR